MARLREVPRRTPAARRDEHASRSERWWAVAKSVRGELSRDEASLTAAGIAFYSLLAIPFLLGAVVSVYGLVADPATIERQLQGVSGALPEGASDLLTRQLGGAVERSGGALGLTFVVSLVGALWSASKAVTAMMSACNIAYDQEEERSALRYYGTALGLTAGFVLAGVVVLGLVAVLPPLLGSIGLGTAAALAVQVLRWPLLLAVFVGGLAVVYRYAASRPTPPWRRTTPGAIAAAVVFALGSVAFSLYVAYMGSYEAYGALAGVVVAMLWLWIFGYAVVLGAELNAELERRQRA